MSTTSPTPSSVANIRIDGKELLVKPPKYPSDEVKEILGGRWDKKEKAWRVQPTALNVLCLGEWYGDAFIADAPEPVQDLFRLDWGFRGFDAPWNDYLKERAEAHPHWEELYDFQKVAVEYLVCNPHHGAILGLSPGLGKTPVTVIAMDVLGLTKVLVLAPLTLAKNWGKEIDRWAQYFRSWSRATASDKNPKSETVITNFETVFYTVVRDEDGNTFNEVDDTWVRNATKVKAWIKEGPTKHNPKTGKQVPVRERLVQPRLTYANIDWDLIVVDESILLKNRKAVKVDVIQQLAKYTHHVWMLSGSPTAKYRDDLYPQVKTIMPRGFSSYWRFAEFFTIVDKGQWGWEIVADRPDNDPQKYLKDFLFVRNQKDVLPDLPDYIYDPIEIDLTPAQDKAFQQMVDEWIVQLGEEDDPEAEVTANNRLAQATRMLQITSNLCNLEKAVGKPIPSESAKENLLADMIEQGDIEFPLLVWCWWVPTGQSVADRITKIFEKQGKDKKNWGVNFVHGALKPEEKDYGIESFKSGDSDVLVLQMGVGKFGHTLTDTRTVFYHDRSFDSDAYLQSLRRVKRIGLTHSPRLIVPRAPKSADPLVEMNLAGKMQSISKVASHDLQELLRSLGGLDWAMNSPGDID